MSQELFIEQLRLDNEQLVRILPDIDLVNQFVVDLYGYLFIPKNDVSRQHYEWGVKWASLKSHLHTLVYEVINDGEKSQRIADNFFEQIPAVYDLLKEDALAVLANDPAAKSLEEVLLTYPGFFAVATYRFAHLLYQLKVPVLPRILTEYAHSQKGIDIHPGAVIGKRFFIDHGTGVVIGETSVIGDDVKIYQGVTIGAVNSAKSAPDVKRHPTIEDNVIIYSGATILGGKTIVGKNSVIGGNVWLTYSVPENSIVYHKSEVVAKDGFSFKESVDDILLKRNGIVPAEQ